MVMPATQDVALDSDVVLDAFRNVKQATDDFIVNNHLDTYCGEFLPKSNKIAISIFCTVLEELGCPIRSAKLGTKLERIKHAPQHKKYVDYIYRVLERNAGLVDIHDKDITSVTRTANEAPSSNIDAMFDQLLRERPAQEAEIELMRLMSPKISNCLQGEGEAIHYLFGSREGRALLDRLYATSDASSAILEQLETFLKAIGSEWPSHTSPLKILEIGAGTGGTTSRLLPALAALDIPIEYTISDLSALLVSEAATTYAQYPFLKFKVVDIEKEPDEDLLNSQHIVLGSNVLHATKNLTASLKLIRKMLREDGFLIFHEMTSQMLWADAAFGLIEGWWRFEDGRQHALQSTQAWEKVISSAGYGFVDWTDGSRPEAKSQNLIFAMASDPGSVYG
ncbi:S-adenosyl-L-methionine-dependent methyltransferase [Trichoderma aethiopicum]